MEDIFEKYKQEICQMCKATTCNNNITVLNDRIKTIKCEEYIKDEEKIKIPEKFLNVTARQYKIMK